MEASLATSYVDLSGSGGLKALDLEKVLSIPVVEVEPEELDALRTRRERALTIDFSVSLGYVNSAGRNMPVLVDRNLIPTGLTLADGAVARLVKQSGQTQADRISNECRRKREDVRAPRAAIRSSVWWSSSPG